MNLRAATAPRRLSLPDAWAADRVGPGCIGSGRWNGGRAGSATGSSSPAFAMPRTTPPLTPAARTRSDVDSGVLSASAAAIRVRASVSRASAGMSPMRHPGWGVSGRRAFTRNAIASTSPGVDRVYPATQSMKRRSATGNGTASSTAVMGFNLVSATDGPDGRSHTTPTSSRRFSGTSTTSPGRGSMPGGTA